MPYVVHLLCVLLALVCFVFDAYQNPAPTRVTSAGLAFLVASMIPW